MFNTITPRRTARLFAVAAACAASCAVPAAAQAFNPQPDPPGFGLTIDSGPLNPGLIVGFNPQPDPPGFVLVIGIWPPGPCDAACETGPPTAN